MVTDQGGTEHTYAYDALGRVTQDRATTLGSGVDGTVRRIGRTYDVRGLVASVTSGGTVVDDDDTTLAAYRYLGLGSVVQQRSPEADLLYTLADLNGTDDPTTGDIYSGLDRFGQAHRAAGNEHAVSQATGFAKG